METATNCRNTRPTMVYVTTPNDASNQRSFHMHRTDGRRWLSD